MAVVINCSLNVSSPPPPSVPPLKINRIPSFCRKRQVKEESGSWRNQVFVGVACMIIGFEMVPLVTDNYHSCCAFAAEELNLINNSKDQRWSDKRICPPWKMNSLETIVPENLPRPSAHRKFEAITHPSTAPSTSITRFTAKAIRSNCFSL